MPVYNVAPYLEECLESVLSQALQRIEVIAVDDGSTDGSGDILARFAQRDRRVTVVRQTNAGQGAARNLGVSRARGTFLTFLDADDTLPPTAYQQMVETLRRTGSDFVVGEVQRVRNDVRSAPPWAHTVHERDRLGITIDDFPDALQDVIACNRVFRRQFWVSEVGGFENGRGAYEDHVPMVKAYVRARRFDVLKRVTYYWRIRENRTSTGQQKHRLDNLRDRVAVKAEAQELLEREASTTVFSTWLGRVLDLDLPPYVKHALAADDDYRAVLADAYRRHIAMATPQAWRTVRVLHKLRGWHAAMGRWDVVEAVQQHVRDYGQPPRTLVRDGRVWVDPTFVGLIDPDTPHELFELADSETALDARLLRARWDDRGRLHLHGWAVVRAVEPGTEDHRLTLSLCHDESGARVVLGPVLAQEPRADAIIGDPETSYAGGGFDVVVDPRRLLAESDAAGRWRLEAEVSTRGVTRLGGFSGAVGGGSAAAQSLTSVDVNGHRATPAWDSRAGFVLDVVRSTAVEPADSASSPSGPVVVTAVVDDTVADGPALVVTVSGMPAEPLAEGLRLVGDRLTVDTRPPTEIEDGHQVVVPLVASSFGGPRRPLPGGSYRLALPDGTTLGAGEHFRTLLPLEQTSGDLNVRWTYARNGQARLTVMSGLAPVERSRWARRRVVDGYAGSDAPAVDQIFFHSREGQAACGAPAAISREVAALRPEMPVVWSTVDRSVVVPEGARQVVVGSAEWAHELHRSRFVVADGPVEGLLSPPGRRWTYVPSGHQLSSTGHDRWVAAGWSQEQIREEMKRFGRWDLVVAAGPQSASAIATDLRYDGEVAIVGDPATDLVVSGDDTVRKQVLDRLSINPSSLVVLYAPADRLAEATSARTGRLSRLLDLRRLQASLGPAVTVLVRGGPAVARGSDRVHGLPGVIDVTDYPEESELVLAADAAVLDYTALRFTWALTGKPVVFHQPDLEVYAAAHPALLPWDESTIGPVVTTTGEVADALKDPSRLVADHAAAVERVNATFNALADGRAAARAAAALLREH
ncbi:bifunctional glycosyltransferase family 2 protein/CDP-glycerol:glycerophosphate glycerophosphotransferase [Mumia sp. zg.B21]|uniref:bifunctional glycosyltransferase/CDP-glycerol:glycerophosphate glycerophosphotransferase n=1 Tax=Mumia sp. zg.B21 TaxID=2855447 RepID=UPI001C6DFEA6|nr:CDP-glycerol glycerophosphotransferase family protein [Mumia sp. zg.B21]MBW9209494.1 bifunctional glycosyltransferase family 2 protein/CDP-glycerol:glycerophosphate glycerophosphotransferase [Mumia sp. zg.B21]